MHAYGLSIDCFLHVKCIWNKFTAWCGCEKKQWNYALYTWLIVDLIHANDTHVSACNGVYFFRNLLLTLPLQNVMNPLLGTSAHFLTGKNPLWERFNVLVSVALSTFIGTSCYLVMWTGFSMFCVLFSFVCVLCGSLACAFVLQNNEQHWNSVSWSCWEITTPREHKCPDNGWWFVTPVAGCSGQAHHTTR